MAEDQIESAQIIMTSRFVDGSEFASFAASNLALWSDLVGARVRHTEHGDGLVQEVQQRDKYIPIITIDFGGSTTFFNADSFRNGKTSIELDETLAQLVIEHAVKRQRERERKQLAIVRFAPLAERYKISPNLFWEDDSSISPLPAILEKIEGGELPNEEDFRWMEEEKQYRLIAIAYYKLFRRAGDHWPLVKACKYLRSADMSNEAITLTNGIDFASIADSRARSALLTTRGAAFRDNSDTSTAKQLAYSAIDASPSSYHAYNLMGGLLYDEGRPAEGDKFFEEARLRGALAPNQDREIAQSLQRSSIEVRDRVITYLLSKDPARYSWVEQLRS